MNNLIEKVFQGAKIHNLTKLIHEFFKLCLYLRKAYNAIFDHALDKGWHGEDQRPFLLDLTRGFYYISHMMGTKHGHIGLWDSDLFDDPAHCIEEQNFCWNF